MKPKNHSVTRNAGWGDAEMTGAKAPVQIGVAARNPVQPECMDPITARNRSAKQPAFEGCVGTQTTFPCGPPDDRRACPDGTGPEFQNNELGSHAR